MRKLFSFFVALLATSILWAYDFQSGDLYYNITSDTTVEVTYQEFSDNNYFDLTSVTIPEIVTYNGTTYSVTSIGDNAFCNCSSLISITIPVSVTSIGNFAFYNCSSLISITIPVSVTSIGNSAFYNCSYSLISIMVDEANEIYDSREGCNAIIETSTNKLILGCQNTIIPNSVTQIGEYAFSGCIAFSSFVIPEWITSIGYSAFSGCSSLTHIEWNAKKCADVSDIPNESASPLYHVSSQITSIVFGENVEHIPAHLCQNMTQLTTIVLPMSVKTIGPHAFRFCSALTSINIPNSIVRIGDFAFENCSSLSSIIIPNSVIDLGNTITVLGGRTFRHCTSLKSVTIGNGVKRLAKQTFYGCSSLSSVTLNNSITHIESQTFERCSSLTNITLPATVDSIEYKAFHKCDSLKSIYCFATMPPIIDDNINTNDGVTLYVPCNALLDYQSNELWKQQFVEIQCISSEEVTTEEVVVEPAMTDVSITWPTDEDAYTYELELNKNSEVVCALTFNALGQLLDILFAAPARNGVHNPIQYAEQVTNGFRFTITGLDEATNYTYTIISKNEQNSAIQTYSGNFTTQSNIPLYIDDLGLSDNSGQKLIRDGQLIILRDGVEYTIMGQEL